MYRTLFPLLDQQVYGHPLVYLDNAATTQKPRQVVETMSDYYLHLNSNIHRGVHHLSQVATSHHEEARKAVADFIHADSSDEIVFTKGTTDSLNALAFSLGELKIKNYELQEEPYIHEGDEIIVSAQEHHSNIVPWQMLCERKKAVLRHIPLRNDLTLDIEAFKAHPKWIQGFSDNTNTLFYLTTKADVATAYGANFGDFGMQPWDKSVKSGLGVLEGDVKVQESFETFQDGFGKRETGLEGYAADGQVEWKNICGEEGGKICVQGRLIGGCMDVIMNLAGTPYDGVKEFIEKYDLILPEYLRKYLINSPDDKWGSGENLGGICLNDCPDAHLTYDGEMLSVKNSEELKKYRKEYIAKEKQIIHPSLKEYNYNLYTMETKDWLIRIDDTKGLYKQVISNKNDKTNYRFAAWKKGKTISDEPDIVIDHGTKNDPFRWEGYEYTFASSEYYCTFTDESKTPRPIDAQDYYLHLYKSVIHEEPKVK